MKATYRAPYYCRLTDGLLGSRTYTIEVASIDDAIARVDASEGEEVLVAIDGIGIGIMLDAQRVAEERAPRDDDDIPF